MANIHVEARRGTLTGESLKKYLARDPDIINLPGGCDDVTPLAAACKGGHLEVVCMLLANSANPNAVSPHGRTPLFFATARSPAHNRCAIVRTLLDFGARIDEASFDDGFSTPLMNAITETRDKDVIQELVQRGASLVVENIHGQTPKMLAQGTPWIQDLLIPSNKTPSCRAELIELIVATVVSLITYVSNEDLTYIVGNVVRRLCGIMGSNNPTIFPTMNSHTCRDISGERQEATTEHIQEESITPESGRCNGIIIQTNDGEAMTEHIQEECASPANEYYVGSPLIEAVDEPLPEIVTVARVVHDIDEYVAKTGLNGFYTKESPFLRDLARNAAALSKEPTNTLSSPENIERLTLLSLYKPIIYCDDSSSMDSDGRFEKQRLLVTRIARISTQIVPDDTGVDLHFINRDSSFRLSAQQVEFVMGRVTPDGATMIGTGLRRKILEPLVYKILRDPAKRLERPLLVSTITDGSPCGEVFDTFKNTIVECKEALRKAGYRPHAVMFSVSQIGNASDAAAFLEQLRNDPEIQDVVYCTTDQLDSRFQDLRANEKMLDEWLLETLTRPIMDRDEAEVQLSLLRRVASRLRQSALFRLLCL